MQNTIYDVTWYITFQKNRCPQDSKSYNAIPSSIITPSARRSQYSKTHIYTPLVHRGIARQEPIHSLSWWICPRAFRRQSGRNDRYKSQRIRQRAECTILARLAFCLHVAVRGPQLDGRFDLAWKLVSMKFRNVENDLPMACAASKSLANALI